MAAEASYVAEISKHLVDILKVAISAFFGAWAAFKFQQYNQDQRKIEEQFAEGKKAQFILYTQFNALLNFKTQILDKHRNDKARAFIMPPFLIHSEFPELNINALSYILDGDDPNLLAEMLVTEQRFRTLLGTLNQRNNYHEQFQQTLSGSEFTGPQMTYQDAETIVGKATLKILEDLTEVLYGGCDDAIKSHLIAFRKLRELLLRKFKGKRPLGIEINAEIIEAILGPERKDTEKSIKEKSA